MPEKKLDTENTEPEYDLTTFAGRQAEREAAGRPATGPFVPRGTFRAGHDTSTATVTVTRRSV